MNFEVLWLIFAKVFSHEFLGAWHLLGAQLAAPASNLRMFSPRKSCFLPIHESFLPRKIPAIRYLIIKNLPTL